MFLYHYLSICSHSTNGSFDYQSRYEMLEKIAMGKRNKFMKENTLLKRVFVRDGKKTVPDYLAETEIGEPFLLKPQALSTYPSARC